MRWLLLFLIALNAVVLFWFGQQQKTESTQDANSVAASTAGVPTIALLSEVPRNKIKYKKAEPEPKDIEPPPAAAAAPVAAEQPAAEFETATAVPQTESAIQTAKPEEAKPEQAKPAEPKAADAAVAEVVKPAIKDKPANKDMCGFLGPFAEPITVRQVAGRLKRAQIDVKTYSESTSINPIYWVYLKPAPSRAEALAKLRELQAARIESFIVGEGEDVNAISLGFYKKKESAEVIRQQRIEQGYDARLIRKDRRRDQYWTVVQPQSWPRVDAPLLAELRGEYGEFTRRARKCGFVASYTQFE